MKLAAIRLTIVALLGFAWGCILKLLADLTPVIVRLGQ